MNGEIRTSNVSVRYVLSLNQVSIEQVRGDRPQILKEKIIICAHQVNRYAYTYRIVPNRRHYANENVGT